MENGSGSLPKHLRIVEQEVNRRMALGVQPILDRSELLSEAHEALAVALNRGTKAVRLAIRNALIDRVRREETRVRYGGDMPEQIVSADFQESVVGELVFTLTPRQVEAVRLVYYFGITEAEAAGEMGCTQQVVHKILSAAIGGLKEKLQGIGC